MKGVLAMSRRADFATNIVIRAIVTEAMSEQRERYAAMKDVHLMLRREEFVLVMVPRGRLAVLKGVLVMSRRVDFATDIVMRAIVTEAMLFQIHQKN